MSCKILPHIHPIISFFGKSLTFYKKLPNKRLEREIFSIVSSFLALYTVTSFPRRTPPTLTYPVVYLPPLSYNDVLTDNYL